MSKKVLAKKEYGIGQLNRDKKAVCYIILTYEYYKEGRRWVAYCRELGTSTFAYNLILAKERIQEAVLCHLNCLEEVNERESFFTENNIKFYPVRPKETPTMDITPDTNHFYQYSIQPIPALVGARS